MSSSVSRIVWLVVVSACGRAGFDLVDPPALSEWAYRQELVVDVAVEGTHSQFAAAVVLAPDKRSALALRQDLQDLRITTEQGDPLVFELERSSFSQTVVAWVQLPLLVAGARFYVYGGNPDAVAVTANPWPATYRAVWLGTNGLDASAYTNDAMVNGPTPATGKIGDAIALDGIDDHVRVPIDMSLEVADQLTVSGWIKPTIDSGFRALFSRPTGATANSELYLGIRDGDLYCEIETDTSQGAAVQLPATLPVDTWIHLAFTYDGTNFVGYVDGVEIFDRPVAGRVLTSTNDALLGADCNTCAAVPNEDFFKGVFDDVRIEGVPRSREWILASILAADDALFIAGPVEPW